MLVPSGSGLTKRPLSFTLVARGRAPADELDKRSIDIAGFVHTNFPFAEGMVQTFGMGEKTRAAVDRMDFNTHLAIFLIARRALRPVKVTLRVLKSKTIQLCTDVRVVGDSLEPEYAYTVTSVRKPPGYDRSVARDTPVFPLVREGKRLIFPKPRGLSRPDLCP